jgi:hypothetical protein
MKVIGARCYESSSFVGAPLINKAVIYGALAMW